MKSFVIVSVVCGVLFGVFTLAAFAASPDDSPPASASGNYGRKNGDMMVYWSGSRTTSTRRSTRVGSSGNRSVQGGGLRGGK